MKFESVEEMICWYVTYCFSSDGANGVFDAMCELYACKAAGLPIADSTVIVDHEEEIDAKIDFDNILGLNRRKGSTRPQKFTESEQAAILVYGLMHVIHDEFDLDHLTDRFDNGIGYASQVLSEGCSLEDVICRYFGDSEACISYRSEPSAQMNGTEWRRITSLFDRFEKLMVRAGYVTGFTSRSKKFVDRDK